MFVRKLKLSNLHTVAAVFIQGIASLLLMTFAAEHAWYLFMLSIVPCCSNTITARSFGFELLMNHHDGDNGSVSSVLNFNTFILAFIGMVVASSFPEDMFIYGIAFVLLMCCTVFATMWILLRHFDYPVKNLKN